jgi:hypothetical protein
MDALTLLKADHEAVEAKFARFEALGPRARKSKAAVVADVIEALSVHAAIEEQVLYPAVRERLTDEEGQVLEALEEHHVVKRTLSELDGMNPDHERFDAKFTVLIETFVTTSRRRRASCSPRFARRSPEPSSPISAMAWCRPRRPLRPSRTRVCRTSHR